MCIVNEVSNIFKNKKVVWSIIEAEIFLCYSQLFNFFIENYCRHNKKLYVLNSNKFCQVLGYFAKKEIFKFSLFLQKNEFSSSLHQSISAMLCIEKRRILTFHITMFVPRSQMKIECC